MTPRKEQIKDLETKHFSVRGVGGDIGFAGTSYQIDGAKLTDLLAASVTHAVGGSEADVRPTVWGGAGPFVLAAGNQFSITIPGVNSGNPVVVTVGGGDVVLIGGVNRLTAARAAKMINAAMAGAGVATPVAYYEGGRLVLRSATGAGPATGASKTMRIADVTTGVVAAFGFGTGSVTVSGISAPARGIVTHGRDGKGGVVELRQQDGSPPVLNNRLLHVGQNRLVRQYAPGDAVYGRITYEPTSSSQIAQLRFYRKAVVPPTVRSNGADFASMSGADSLTITVGDSTLGYSGSFVVSMAGVTDRATFIAAVNAAWGTFTAAAVPSGQAGRAVLVSSYEPFDVLAADTLYFTVDGGLESSTTLGSDLWKAADVAFQINAAIVGSGGSAAVWDDGVGKRVVVRSGTASGASSLRLHGAVAGKLGLVDSTAVGFPVCSPDGGNEVSFSLPSSGAAGASIIVDGTVNGAYVRLGFSAPTAAASAVYDGEEAVEAPTIPVLGTAFGPSGFFPEMVEFWEIQVDQESASSAFSRASAPGPGTGPSTDSASRSPLLGPDGKLLAELVPAIDKLRAGGVDLGGGMLEGIANLLKARITAPYSGSSWTLVSDIADISGAGVRVRTYALAGFGLVTTHNAHRNPVGSWLMDNTALPAGRFDVNSYGVAYFTRAAVVGDFSDWQEQFNTADGVSTGVVDVGSGAAYNTPTVAYTKARVHTLPVLDQPTLMWSNHDPGNGSYVAQRVYMTLHDSAPGELWITTNAYLSGAGLWTADNAGAAPQAIVFQDNSFKILGSSTFVPWSTWNVTALEVDPTGANPVKVFNGVKLGVGLTSTSGKIVPRVKADHTGSGVTPGGRTLVLESVSNLIGLRIYTSETFNGAGTPGQHDSILVTVNARWDGTNWFRDVAAVGSTAYKFSGGYLNIYSKIAASWADNAWDTNAEVGPGAVLHDGVGNSVTLGGFGLTMPAAYNTLATFSNTLTSTNIPKAFGTVYIGNPAGLATPVMRTNGFGVTSVARVDANTIRVVLFNPMNAITYTVIPGVYRDDGAGGLGPCPIQVCVFPEAADRFLISAYYLDNGSLVNFDTQGASPVSGVVISRPVVTFTVLGNHP